MESEDAIKAATDASFKALLGLLQLQRQAVRARWDELASGRTALATAQQALCDGRSVSAVPSDVIKLNVGGEQMAARRETLTMAAGSRLAAMFSGRWDELLEKDRDERIFLDYDPKCFRKLLDHLLEMKMHDPTAAKLPIDVPAEIEQGFDLILGHLHLQDFLYDQEDGSLPEKMKAKQQNQAAQLGSTDDESESRIALLKAMQDLSAESVELDGLFVALQYQKDALADEKEFMAEMVKEHGDDDILYLNVSGQAITVKRSTLLLCPGSALATKFDAKRWSQQATEDEDQRVFLELNPYCFQKVVDFMRMQRLVADPSTIAFSAGDIRPDQMPSFKRLIDYYGLEEHIDMTPPFVADSAIVCDGAHAAALHEWIGAGKETELLYRGTRDGLTPQSFHQRCDNKGPTLTVVKSTCGYLCGAYTDQSWLRGNGAHAQSQVTFVFSLTSPHVTQPTKFEIEPNQYGSAVYHYTRYGAAFTIGHVYFLSNQGATCSSSLNSGYFQNPTGVANLAANTSFAAAEMEVYAVRRADGPASHGGKRATNSAARAKRNRRGGSGGAAR
jgi:hypothetical protein